MRGQANVMQKEGGIGAKADFFAETLKLEAASFKKPKYSAKNRI